MKVFISHSHETKDLARDLERVLENLGWDVWNDDKILPGQNWAEEIARALKEAEAMVVLLTPEDLESTRVRREIDFALTNKSFSQRLVPVLVNFEDGPALGKVPWIFNHLKMINLSASSRAEGINKITRALQATV